MHDIEPISAWLIPVPIQCTHVLSKKMANKDQEYVIDPSIIIQVLSHIERVTFVVSSGS